MILKLTEQQVSGLSGPDVLRLIVETVEQEREANARIADEEAEHLSKHGASAEIAQRIAARIRARS